MRASNLKAKQQTRNNYEKKKKIRRCEKVSDTVNYFALVSGKKWIKRDEKKGHIKEKKRKNVAYRMCVPSVATKIVEIKIVLCCSSRTSKSLYGEMAN